MRNLISPHLLILAYACIIFLVIWVWPGYLWSKQRGTVVLTMALAAVGWYIAYLGAEWLPKESEEYMLTARRYGQVIMLGTAFLLLTVGSWRMLRRR